MYNNFFQLIHSSINKGKEDGSIKTPLKMIEIFYIVHLLLNGFSIQWDVKNFPFRQMQYKDKQHIRLLISILEQFLTSERVFEI